MRRKRASQVVVIQPAVLEDRRPSSLEELVMRPRTTHQERVRDRLRTTARLRLLKGMRLNTPAWEEELAGGRDVRATT